jgi:hypothetical protein
MVNPIAQVIGGLIGGLVAGLIGYAVDTAIGAVFNALGYIIPMIALFGVIYAIISFAMGINDAIVAGFFFSVGVIFAGWAVGDVVTVAGGFIALAVLLFPLVKGLGSSD